MSNTLAISRDLKVNEVNGQRLLMVINNPRKIITANVHKYYLPHDRVSSNVNILHFFLVK